MRTFFRKLTDDFAYTAMATLFAGLALSVVVVGPDKADRLSIIGLSGLLIASISILLVLPITFWAQYEPESCA